jgi:putative FmdB family regulatory protein
MPMYEYKCHKCGKVFERIQRFSDPELTVHDDCGGELEKLVSAPAFHLKGSGWYATDYAKGSGANPAPKASGEGTAKSDGGSSSSESKSESKSDSKSDSKKDSAPAPAAPTATKDSSTK